MRKKPRNALVNENFIDLGVIEMKEVQPSKKEFRIELEEPKNWQERNEIIVGIYKMFDDVETPKYQTQKSACFDIPTYLGKEIVVIDVYNRMLMHLIKSVSPMKERDGVRGFSIEPGESAFVPTGLVFDIPENFKIAFYPRSGTSGKKHLKLSNSVAVIDEDFTTQSMLIIFNDSDQRQIICHGDRLAQAEVVPVYRAMFEIIEKEVEQKTDRVGGMGSTGTRVV